MFFMILTVLRNIGLAFCGVFLNLSLADVFLMIRLEFWDLAKNTIGECSPHRNRICNVHMVSLVMQTIITWITWCLPGFSTVKLLFLPFYSLLWNSVNSGLNLRLSFTSLRRSLMARGAYLHMGVFY